MAVRGRAPEELYGVAWDVLRALGTPDDIAAEVASSLVDAQAVGHDSHGLIRLVEYAGFVERGIVRPAARAEVVSTAGSTAVVDGHHGWGHPACRLAVRQAATLARSHGTAGVTVRHCNHVGRIGEYVESLAGQGLVGLAWCNAEPVVAPYGGRARMLGTNPIAAGIPLGPGVPPLVLDFATAAIAEGKLRVARATSAPIPGDVVVDADGRPATSPEAFYAGGALLPFGGHKGYGLSVVVEMLGGALSGNHPSSSPAYVSGNGVVLLALDPGSFVDEDAFVADVAGCAAALRASPPVVPERPVLVPGDLENAQRTLRHEQVPVADEIWDEVARLSERLRARGGDVPL